MNTFYFKKQIFIFIVLTSIVLIGFQFLNRDDRQDPLTLSSFRVFSEIQTASVNFYTDLFSILQKYLFLLELRDKNKILEEENKTLKIKQQQFEEVLQENERLKQIIDFQKNKSSQLLASKIIGSDFLSNNQLFTINKGHLHGVKKKMGVIHPKGVFGYVFRTSRHSSQVITLLHPLSSLPVRNKTSRAVGLLKAGENNQLIIDFWNTHIFEDQIQDSFKEKDTVVTMESDQFPPGFLVGQILPFNYSSKNLTPDIYVQPFVDFNSLEEVFVVLKRQDKAKNTGDKNETGG